MKLYVSGPMTGRPLHNVEEFARAAADARARGHEVHSPAEMDLADGLDPSDPESWMSALHKSMARDMRCVLDCDGVLVLDGWEHSKGACMEVAVAWYAGKVVLDRGFQVLTIPRPYVKVL